MNKALRPRIACLFTGCILIALTALPIRAQKAAKSKPAPVATAEQRTARALESAKANPLDLHAFLVRMPKGDCSCANRKTPCRGPAPPARRSKSGKSVRRSRPFPAPTAGPRGSSSWRISLCYSPSPRLALPATWEPFLAPDCPEATQMQRSPLERAMR